MIKKISIILILLMVFNPLAVLAYDEINQNLSYDFNNNSSGIESMDKEKALKITGGLIVVGTMTYLYRRYKRNKKLEKMYNEALLLEKDSQYKEAISIYEDILNKDEDYKDVNNRLISLKNIFSDKLVEKSKNLIKQEKYNKAYKKLLEAKRYNPNSYENERKIINLEKRIIYINYNQGINYFNQREYQKAYNHFSLVKNIDKSYKEINTFYQQSLSEINIEDLKVITFFNDLTTSTLNLEKYLIDSLYKELKNNTNLNIVDNKTVEKIKLEQALLNENKDLNASKDIANILNSNKIITGEIVYLKGKEILINLDIYNLNEKDFNKRIEFEHEFQNELNNLNQRREFEKLSKKLVKEIL